MGYWVVELYYIEHYDGSRILLTYRTTSLTLVIFPVKSFGLDCPEGWSELAGAERRW